jgi:hypothetical protein
MTAICKNGCKTEEGKGSQADELAARIIESMIPSRVCSVTIEYVDDGTRHDCLIAEVESPDDLRYGFTDEDIFFYGMSPLEAVNAYNKQIVCEGEWIIVEYNGIASPVDYVTSREVEQKYGNGNIPPCGANMCGEFKRYEDGRTACNYFGIDNISPDVVNTSCPLNQEYHH